MTPTPDCVELAWAAHMNAAVSVSVALLEAIGDVQSALADIDLCI